MINTLCVEPVGQSTVAALIGCASHILYYIIFYIDINGKKGRRNEGRQEGRANASADNN